MVLLVRPCSIARSINIFWVSGITLFNCSNADLSLADDQKELYDWKFSTIDAFRDEYEDKKRTDYTSIFIIGYNSEKEARTGHINLVKHIKKHGIIHSEDDEIIRRIATGK